MNSVFGKWSVNQSVTVIVINQTVNDIWFYPYSAKSLFFSFCRNPTKAWSQIIDLTGFHNKAGNE